MTETPEWQGRLGAIWAQHAGALDAMLAPVGQAGLDAMGQVAGRRIVDIGCGAGACSLALAGAGASVLGVDISPDLLEVARIRARDSDCDSSCEFKCADIVQVARDGGLADADGLFSRCGTMFFDDQEAAWRAIAQGLGAGRTDKKECRIVLAVWASLAENDWARVPLKLAEPILGAEISAPPPLGVPGPFGWAEESYFAPMLKKSGLRNLSWHKVSCPAPCSFAQAGIAGGVEFMLNLGPLAARLRGAEPETRAEVARLLEEGLAEYVVDGKLVLGTTAWIIKGTMNDER